jgi:hypothetical protein
MDQTPCVEQKDDADAKQLTPPSYPVCKIARHKVLAAMELCSRQGGETLTYLLYLNYCRVLRYISFLPFVHILPSMSLPDQNIVDIFICFHLIRISL